jgi:hypothetical protein
VAAHRLGQRRAGHIRGRQPGHRGVQVRVHHERGKQAAYLLSRDDLAPEPGPEVRIGGQFGPDDLNRDRPTPRRHAQEHSSHAAAAELPQQSVRSDLPRVIGLQSGVPQFLPRMSAKTRIHAISGRRGRKVKGLHGHSGRKACLRTRGRPPGPPAGWPCGKQSFGQGRLCAVNSRYSHSITVFPVLRGPRSWRRARSVGSASSAAVRPGSSAMPR